MWLGNDMKHTIFIDSDELRYRALSPEDQKRIKNWIPLLIGLSYLMCIGLSCSANKMGGWILTKKPFEQNRHGTSEELALYGAVGAAIVCAAYLMVLAGMSYAASRKNGYPVMGNMFDSIIKQSKGITTNVFTTAIVGMFSFAAFTAVGAAVFDADLKTLKFAATSGAVGSVMAFTVPAMIVKHKLAQNKPVPSPFGYR